MPNGHSSAHQGYDGIENQPGNVQHPHANTSTAAPQSSTPMPGTNALASSASGQQSDVPKDQVGWYFVEQYYTALSRQPERLYLFYNKRSQLVSGEETEKVDVCVGQRAINEKIKELDFQDCKVRVTNVDSQASDSGIVIQVIGEISNKSQPHRRFVQTFVLATQTSGYFVLNDIFRYVVDEEDEQEPAAESVGALDESSSTTAGNPPEPAVPAATATEAKSSTSSTDPADVEEDAKQIDHKLEETLASEKASSGEPGETILDGTGPAATSVDADLDAASSAPLDASSVSTETKSVDPKPEDPKDPESTRAASPPASRQTRQPPVPTPMPKPAVLKTWASLVSANPVATPAVPSTASSNGSQPRAPSSAPKPSKPASGAPPVPSVTSTAPAPASAPTVQRDESPATSSQDEWTAVGSSHQRQQSKQTNTHQPIQPTRAYIKNVFETVDKLALRTQLEKFGQVIYIDIAPQKV